MSDSSTPGVNQVTVIGGGQAAATACATLRASGYDGELILISDESTPPYQRPPLSKAYLKGELPGERLLIKPASWYEGQAIDLRCGTKATAIDADQRQVETSGGAVDFERLVIATGSRPRQLPMPGSNLQGVFELRSIEHVDALREALGSARRLVVVGAGYIGLEAAASARSLGIDVTVLEYAPRVLARVTSPEISTFFEALHERQGVRIVTDARITRLNAKQGQVSEVELESGESIAADCVLLGVGIEPNVELAQAAGIVCDNGIVVNRDAQTSHPAIYSAGDCTSRELVHYQRQGRLESVHNAIEQGRQAAAHILGRPRPTEEAPWFWSDQYHVKLQIAGLSAGHNKVVTRGDPASEQFALFYLDGDRLLATDAINASPEFVFARKLIAAGARLNAGALEDTAIPMKTIAAEALAASS
ncbi:MAG: FAD-dependent oxidoreductase [Pseudomonadota bacterium]